MLFGAPKSKDNSSSTFPSTGKCGCSRGSNENTSKLTMCRSPNQQLQKPYEHGIAYVNSHVKLVHQTLTGIFGFG